MRCVLFKAAVLAGLVSFVCLMSTGSALATPDQGGSCTPGSGCHNNPVTGRETTTFTPTSLTASPDQTVTISTHVTGPGNSTYVVLTGKLVSGHTTQDLIAIPGTGNANNKLNVPIPASGWTADSGNGYTIYVADWSSAATFDRTFSFVVPTGTPADTYPLRIAVGGSGGGRWAQFTDFNLTVGAAPEPGTLAMVLGGALVGFICWRGRKHLAAK